ncbi:uncharacterized protein SPAPADRAFT_60612 [Spathaspora passalidarum NRRL Y-27907]|uniref:Uncharacterized protein n=1 Tax=Spathaspora passalidarum (strain NRRL Y-27907 / 11-Y1) TaxID=619300 RepID=G3ALN4_SPAPN|nr:uncharacterized protein SPAPADRAFT_60612 [Spathaspora passalidarum NRRL Y-27907]EGW33277.1 hypothetical protein SPAPADRAFT_60612 [Spathaspora passalidarum NRRL Y-27907]
MKVLSLIAALALCAEAVRLPHVAEETPAPTPIATPARLEKRMRDVIVNKEYAKNQAAKTASSTTELPPKWVRTLSDGKVEIVFPTVIAGVTFSAKPPKTTDGLEPWVSLKDDGSPKTMRPEIKGGRTKNAQPTYGTYFQTATTMYHSKEDLGAHNMADDEVFEEVVYLDEDQTNHKLSPLIRCTPDRYKKKGIARDKSTEPFCTPKDDVRLIKDKTYFVTWYSRFFNKEVKNVKIHLSHIKESLRQKGLKKRDDEAAEEEVKEEVTDEIVLSKRSAVLEHGGKVTELSFYTSDWVSNEQGFFPLYIDEKWFGDEYWRKVLLSIQPDNVADEDFDHKKNSLVVEIWKGAKVSKEHLQDLKKLEEKHAQAYLGDVEIEEGIDYEKYMIMITMPTCVIIAAFGMYLFVTWNRVDLSNVRKRNIRTKITPRCHNTISNLITLSMIRCITC